MRAMGIVMWGLLLPTATGCGSTVTSDGGAGGGAGGAGGAVGNCGDKNCTPDEICRSCNADYGAKEYACEPKPPVPGADEFLCHDIVCQVGQYCSLRTSPYCAGQVTESACHDLAPGCVVDPLTCSCLGDPTCADTCSVDADGNWTVQTLYCAP